MCFLAACAHAQQWANKYHSPTETQVSVISAQPAQGGGYIVAGNMSTPLNNSPAWMMKLDSAGNIAWQKQFVPRDSQSVTQYQIASARATVTGGYIVVGAAIEPDAARVWVMNVGPDGSVLWQKIYAGPRSTYARSIHPTADGGYVVTGSVEMGVGGSFVTDLWLLRLDAVGNIIWQKAYRRPSDMGTENSGSFVRPTADGGFIVSGYSREHFGTNGDILWLLRLDAFGAVIWQKSFPSFSNVLSEVHPTADGGYIFATMHRGTDGGPFDAWVVKLFPSGDVVWQEVFGGSYGDEIRSIRPTADGGFIVAGFSGALGPPSLYKHWIIRLDRSGAVEWQRSFDAHLSSFEPLVDGGYLLTGNRPFDFSVVKLDRDGTIPGCEILGTSDLAPVATSEMPTDTAAIITVTNALQTNTDVMPIDTAVELEQVCGYTPLEPSEIPTLAEWGLLLLSAAIGVSAMKLTWRGRKNGILA